MNMSRTHYQTLQVVDDAIPSVIKAAYRSLAQKWHPDKHPDDREKAEYEMRLINQAFAVLSYPEHRKEYDKEIKLKRENLSNKQQSPPPSEELFSWSTVAKIAVIAAAAAFGIDMSSSL